MAQHRRARLRRQLARAASHAWPPGLGHATLGEQEETIHEPKIIQQDRIIQQAVKMIVEMLVPIIQKGIQEEIVHEPTFIQQERIIHQQVEIVVDVPIPMTQEARPPALAIEPLMDQSRRYTDLSLDPEHEKRKIAHTNLLFDRNTIDDRAKICSLLTLNTGNNQGIGDVEYSKTYDIYFPPSHLRLFEGPARSIIDMWRIPGHGTPAGDLVAGTASQAKLGLHPKPVGEASYAPWQGGDFIKNDEAQGNQVFCQMNECISEVVKAMRECIKETASEELRGDRLYPPRPLYPYTSDHRPHHDERKGDREAAMEAAGPACTQSPSARRPTPPGKAAASYRTPRRLPGSQRAPSSREILSLA
jgi:hypothetical protein